VPPVDEPAGPGATHARTGAIDSTPAGDPFDALADRQRREILRLLGAGPRAVHELADELPISRPAVSRHLRLLSDAGLVSEEREGTRRIYSLRAEGVDAVQAYLERVWGDVASRFRMLTENTGPVTAKPVEKKAQE
jgi:DNA-binding transcriptional ArsR family regulator